MVRLAAALVAASAVVASAQTTGCLLEAADPAVSWIASLPRPQQGNAFRALFADGKDHFSKLFQANYWLRPALRGLLSDPEARGAAAAILSLIGYPSDIRAILASPPQGRAPFANRWAYAVVTSLLEPASDDEWAFLRKCALNEFNDRWVDRGAIQSLKLIANLRSRSILEEVQQTNSERKVSATRAIEYIDSGPAPLSGADLHELAERVAQAVRVAEWKGNRPARCSATGDEALVDFTFESPGDRYTYTATFHYVNGIWKLRGVRETMQAMIGHGVITVK